MWWVLAKEIATLRDLNERCTYWFSKISDMEILAIRVAHVASYLHRTALHAKAVSNAAASIEKCDGM